MAFITPLPTTFRPLSTTGLCTRHVPTPIRRSSSSRIYMQGPKRTTEADTPKKVFLDRVKPLGRVRLITRNDTAIMEAIATFDKLFFAQIPSGEYANIVDMSINLDMHLLLDGFTGCRFETGVSRSASRATTYILRLLGKDRESVAMSVFIQWDKDATDIEPERIEAWKALKADYVKDDSETFFF